MVLRAQEKALAVPPRFLKELQRASQQRDRGQRLYKLDLYRAKLTDAHVRATEAEKGIHMVLSKLSLTNREEELGPESVGHTGSKRTIRFPNLLSDIVSRLRRVSL